MVEEGPTRRRVVDAGRQRHRGELGQAVTLLGEQREAELLEAPLQCPAAGLVTGPRRVEAFLQKHTQAGVQGVDHRDRRRVVVPAGGAHVVADQAEVEIPRPGLFHESAAGPVVHRQRGQTGRHTQALLGAGVGHVDAPAVDLHLDPTQRRDAVDQQKGVALAFTERGDVVGHAGRRLGVHHGDDLRCRVGIEQALWVEGTAPRLLHAHHLGATARHHLAHPLPEQSVHADHGHVSGPDHVDEGRLHAR